MSGIGFSFAGATALAQLLDPVFDQASAILDVVALAAIFGSFLVYSRMKAALLVSESTAKSWHEERDAESARAERLAHDLKVTEEAKIGLLAKVTALEQKPDLSTLEGLVRESTESMKNHEIAAGKRTERLIAAVEAINKREAA